HAIVVFRERIAHGRPLHNDETEEVASMADRSHAQLLLLSLLQQTREPNAGPGRARDTCPRHDWSLPGGHDYRAMAEVRHRDRPLKNFTATRIDLCAGEIHGLSQRFRQL